MCVDYTDINRACPKDSFPLPKIDQLIDSTAGNKLPSFMDAFSGYNQIMIHLSDQDNTSFITRKDLYCYKVMPFGLKNAGNKEESDETELRKVCFWGSGKKIPRVHGQIAALNRFISCSTDKCLLFFKIIKQGKKLKWDKQSELAFQTLKEYLAYHPLLVKPFTREELQLYLVVLKAATSGALVKECSDGVLRPMYYVSCAFTKSEKNNTLLEKLANTLVITARKLWPYFQAYTIMVVIDQPLRQFLKRLDVSSRLVLWALELTQFDIKSKARTIIKAEALAGFISKFNVNSDPDTRPDLNPDQTNLNWPEDNKTWTLYTDGASSQSGYGAGIVVIELEGVECSHCFRFEFRATNNEAEYEALLAGMGVAEALGADFLLVKSDSQLIVNHVLGLY
ncbi:hypothetical protein QYF36_000495 [Acer negundo]|nr:hypothetical protein QYF36_000495 [Acer negundo]